MRTTLTSTRLGAKVAAQRARTGFSLARRVAVQFGVRVTDVTMSACRVCGETSLLYALTSSSFLPVSAKYFLYLPPLATMRSPRSMSTVFSTNSLCG